jgi:hypothetical protein
MKRVTPFLSMTNLVGMPSTLYACTTLLSMFVSGSQVLSNDPIIAVEAEKTARESFCVGKDWVVAFEINLDLGAALREGRD